MIWCSPDDDGMEAASHLLWRKQTGVLKGAVNVGWFIETRSRRKGKVNLGDFRLIQDIDLGGEDGFKAALREL
ncbi:hypothetical protein KSS87_019894 [Heliosperma pusillum]|nr:hypothetical protein KSS87_019894 [Heliosperma pusillum]